MSDPTAPPAPTTGVDFLNGLLALREGMIRAIASPAFAELVSNIHRATEQLCEWLAKNPDALERFKANAALCERRNSSAFVPPICRHQEERPEVAPSAPTGIGGYQN